MAKQKFKDFVPRPKPRKRIRIHKKRKNKSAGGLLSHPRSDARVYRVVLGADGVS